MFCLTLELSGIGLLSEARGRGGVGRGGCVHVMVVVESGLGGVVGGCHAYFIPSVGHGVPS